MIDFSTIERTAARNFERAFLSLDGLLQSCELEGTRSDKGYPTRLSTGEIEFWSTLLKKCDVKKEVMAILRLLGARLEDGGHSRGRKVCTVPLDAIGVVRRIAVALLAGAACNRRTV